MSFSLDCSFDDWLKKPIIYHVINTGYYDVVKLLLVAVASINAPTEPNMLSFFLKQLMN